VVAPRSWRSNNFGAAVVIANDHRSPSFLGTGLDAGLKNGSTQTYITPENAAPVVIGYHTPL
jgi:hypothetical protein